MKRKSIFIEIITAVLVLFALMAEINAANNGSSVQSQSMEVYTLPPQAAGESPKGKEQDRQALGYIMETGKFNYCY